MTSISPDSRLSNPWLSVWLRPRATIDAVLTNDPRRHVLLLAALFWIATLALRLIEIGWGVLLLDWRVVVCLVIGGAAWGVVALYVFGLLLRWTGLLLRGGASQVELRAVLAWGFVPVILSLAIVLVAVALLVVAQVLRQHPSATLTIGAEVFASVLGLWSVVVTMLMLGRVQGFGFWRTLANYVFAVLIGGLLIAFLIRTFLFQPFSIPSGSNEPTLLPGDYIFAAKYPYGFSRYSLPFSLPLFSGRIFGAEPRYGDVAVYRLPVDTSLDFVKRVVGLPGDRVQMIAGELHLNGAPVTRERLADVIFDNGRAKKWRETLPNGASYETLDLVDNGPLDNTQIYIVPPEHYFMLGDNRDNSLDSRVLSRHGFVPFENLIGRVDIIFWSVDLNARDTNTEARFNRIWTRVR